MARVEVIDQTQSEDVELAEETLDSNLHYRFTHPRALARRRAQGYEVVLRSESGVRFAHEPEDTKTTDDLIRRGASFLMSCQKSEFKKRERARAALTKARREGTELRFAEKARKRGVVPIIGEEDEK